MLFWNKYQVICGAGDPLIPNIDRRSKKNSLTKEDPSESRFGYAEIQDAYHGFICEQWASFNSNSSSLSWKLLRSEFYF